MGATASIVKDFEDLRSNNELSSDALLRNLEEKHGKLIYRTLQDKYSNGIVYDARYKIIFCYHT